LYIRWIRLGACLCIMPKRGFGEVELVPRVFNLNTANTWKLQKNSHNSLGSFLICSRNYVLVKQCSITQSNERESSLCWDRWGERAWPCADGTAADLSQALFYGSYVLHKVVSFLGGLLYLCISAQKELVFQNGSTEWISTKLCWATLPSVQISAQPNPYWRRITDRKILVFSKTSCAYNKLIPNTFAKQRKANISFVTHVCPSACSNSAPTTWIFMKFDISLFSENLTRKINFH
jgi:hypothetical protein